MTYRPPPAQAQAHPAQAQAHAQDEPPPLPRPPDERKVLELGLGSGLVLLVTAPVKELRLPTAPADIAVTVLVNEAAASEPGSFGRVIVCDLPPDGAVGRLPRPAAPPMERVEAVVRGMPGSARHHQ
jgi:hypothetical protein